VIGVFAELFLDECWRDGVVQVCFCTKYSGIVRCLGSS
jgi:hypothetical protein